MYNSIYDYIVKNMEKNYTIVECGGHMGHDTIKLCEYFNNGKIYTIEANYELFVKLCELKNKYENLHVDNLALSNKDEMIKFYVDKNPEGDCGASSILKSTESYLINYIKKEEETMIKSVKLETFMKNNNIKNIDMLWLDIEGFEYYVFESSENILNNVKYIYTEVNFQMFRENTKLYDDIKNILNKNNFEEVYKWEQGDTWGAWQGNVLFYNTKYIKL